jgi:hypothetical protein
MRPRLPARAAQNPNAGWLGLIAALEVLIAVLPTLLRPRQLKISPPHRPQNRAPLASRRRLIKRPIPAVLVRKRILKHPLPVGDITTSRYPAGGSSGRRTNRVKGTTSPIRTSVTQTAPPAHPPSALGRTFSRYSARCPFHRTHAAASREPHSIP